MINIRLFISGETYDLETFKDEPVNVEISFAEIEDITKRNSTYTKSFKLPGSKKNNEIFNNFYNPRSTGISYDFNKKHPAELTNGGVILFKGNLRLLDVSTTNGEIIYSVSFIAEVGDLLANMSDKSMCDLSLSAYTHEQNAENVYKASKEYEGRSTKFSTIDVIENGSLRYFAIHNGFNYSSTTDPTAINYIETPQMSGIGEFTGGTTFFENAMNYKYLKPAIRLIDLYKEVARENGFNITSDFFDTALAKRYYYPFTHDETTFQENPKFRFTNRDGFNNFINISGFRYNVEAITPNYGQGAYLGGATGNYTHIRLTKGGKYYLRLEYEWGIQNYQGSVPTIIHSIKRSPNGNYTVFEQVYSGSSTYVVGQPITAYDFEFVIDKPDDTEQYYYLDITVEPLILDESYVFPEVRLTLEATDWGEEIQLPSKFPCNLKQVDFIKSVNNLFNLVIIPTENPSQLRVEPMQTYLGQGEDLFWDDKVDYNSTIKVQPTNSLVNGTIEFTAVQDDSFINKEYRVIKSEDYGRGLYDLNQDFKGGTLTFDSSFKAAGYSLMVGDIGSFNVAGNVLGNYFINDDGFIKPLKSSPQYVFNTTDITTSDFGTSLSTSTTWKLGDVSYPFYENYSLPVLNNFTNHYNREGMGNDALFTASTNFDTRFLNDYQLFAESYFDILDITTPYYRFTEYKLTEDKEWYADKLTQYDIFYKQYLEYLTNSDNRFVSCKMFFYPHELNEISFDRNIKVFGGTYRINKISNFNLVNEGFADVELVKTLESYNPPPVRYFRLNPCTFPSEIIYISTNDMWTIQFYNGYYLKRNGVCYEVEEVDSVPSHHASYTFEDRWDGTNGSVDLLKISESCSDCQNNIYINRLYHPFI